MGRYFEHELVEPRVIHDKETFLAALVTPTILHAPAARLIINDVHTCK